MIVWYTLRGALKLSAVGILFGLLYIGIRVGGEYIVTRYGWQGIIMALVLTIASIGFIVASAQTGVKNAPVPKVKPNTYYMDLYFRIHFVESLAKDSNCYARLHWNCSREVDDGARFFPFEKMKGWKEINPNNFINKRRLYRWTEHRILDI